MSARRDPNWDRSPNSLLTGTNEQTLFPNSCCFVTQRLEKLIKQATIADRQLCHLTAWTSQPQSCEVVAMTVSILGPFLQLQIFNT